MVGCWMDVGWLEKAELKPTQPSLAGAWLSLAKIQTPPLSQSKFTFEMKTFLIFALTPPFLLDLSHNLGHFLF